MITFLRQATRLNFMLVWEVGAGWELTGDSDSTLFAGHTGYSVELLGQL